MLEREIKLHFDSAAAARAAILAAGASPLRPRRLQADALFDSSDQSLRRRGCVLRIRNDAGTSVLTFKGPVRPGPTKARDEHETPVGDGEALGRVLALLGLRVWFRYQKFREEYGADRALVAAIDETPIGVFVELEGDEAAILVAASTLGVAHDAFITASYARLFFDRRDARGIGDHDHMVFPA
jgi:adenylate cyclase class 2